MYDLAIIWEWIGFALRWLHIITAMAWIGSSFYFIALDLGLRKAPDLPPGASGEEWQVHGGGFYHIRKYLIAPQQMPEHLTWFKWESYATWLSGAALLVVIYWFGGALYLIDPNKAQLALWQAVLLSAASIAVGWVIYDQLCKSKLGNYPTAMMLALFAMIVIMSWGLNQVFTGRAALLHLGAFTATIMTANVFFIIMPNQRIVVADLKAGKSPDPKYGKIAKLRSTHNNYLTLPVIFLMLSNHYPLAFGTQYSWIIAALVFLMGVVIRHYFNSMHSGKGTPSWTWAVAALLLWIMIWLSSLGGNETQTAELPDALSPVEARYVQSPGFEHAYDIVLGHCSMCHAREPVWDGILWAPKGVYLETKSDVARYADQIYLQAGRSHAMPPPNAVRMKQKARDSLVAWYQGAKNPQLK